MNTNDLPIQTYSDLPVETAPDSIEAPPSAISEEQADQIAGLVGRNWGLLLGFGIILGGLGVAVMVWPEATIGVVAVLLGIALLVSGIFSVIGALTRSDHATPLRLLSGISGALSILLGVLAFSGITEAVTILTLMIGFGWMVRGIGELVVGISAKGAPGRGLTIAAGALGIVAGAVVLLWPSITLLALAYVSGIWLVLLGILQIVLAFRLRKVTSAADLQQALNA